MKRVVKYSDGTERYEDEHDPIYFFYQQGINRLDKELNELQAENKELKLQRDAVGTGFQFGLHFDGVIEIPKNMSYERREVGKPRAKAAAQ